MIIKNIKERLEPLMLLIAFTLSHFLYIGEKQRIEQISKAAKEVGPHPTPEAIERTAKEFEKFGVTPADIERRRGEIDEPKEKDIIGVGTRRTVVPTGEVTEEGKPKFRPAIPEERKAISIPSVKKVQRPTTREEFAKSLFERQKKIVRETKEGLTIIEGKRKTVITPTGGIVDVPISAKVSPKFVRQMVKERREPTISKFEAARMFYSTGRLPLFGGATIVEFKPKDFKPISEIRAAPKKPSLIQRIRYREFRDPGFGLISLPVGVAVGFGKGLVAPFRLSTYKGLYQTVKDPFGAFGGLGKQLRRAPGATIGELYGYYKGFGTTTRGIQRVVGGVKIATGKIGKVKTTIARIPRGRPAGFGLRISETRAFVFAKGKLAPPIRITGTPAQISAIRSVGLVSRMKIARGAGLLGEVTRPAVSAARITTFRTGRVIERGRTRVGAFGERIRVRGYRLEKAIDVGARRAELFTRMKIERGAGLFRDVTRPAVSAARITAFRTGRVVERGRARVGAFGERIRVRGYRLEKAIDVGARRAELFTRMKIARAKGFVVGLRQPSRIAAAKFEFRTGRMLEEGGIRVRAFGERQRVRGYKLETAFKRRVVRPIKLKRIGLEVEAESLFFKTRQRLFPFKKITVSTRAFDIGRFRLFTVQKLRQPLRLTKADIRVRGIDPFLKRIYRREGRPVQRGLIEEATLFQMGISELRERSLKQLAIARVRERRPRIRRVRKPSIKTDEVFIETGVGRQVVLQKLEAPKVRQVARQQLKQMRITEQEVTPRGLPLSKVIALQGQRLDLTLRQEQKRKQKALISLGVIQIHKQLPGVRPLQRIKQIPKQVPIPKPFQALVFRPLQDPTLKPKPAQRQVPRADQPFDLVLDIPPPLPPIMFPPAFPGFPERKKKKGVRGFKPLRFMPSLVPVAKELYGPKPKFLTGLEPRFLQAF